jgi:hypothetical protein
MHFTGIYDPDQLAVLCKVLDDHCTKFGIERYSTDHMDASYLILSLFEKGARTAGELKVALDTALAGDEGRRA